MASRYFNDLADVGDYDLGAFGFKRRKRPTGGGGAGRQMDARRLISSNPGVPNRGLGEQPLGLGATAFTSTSGTLLSLSAQPQRPFRGRRLILDMTRTGTTATGLVTITRLDVGADNQLPGSGAIGAGAFSSTAVGVDLDLSPAQPGVTVTCQLNISAAPTTTDRVDISGTLIGSSLR